MPDFHHGGRLVISGPIKLMGWAGEWEAEAKLDGYRMDLVAVKNVQSPLGYAMINLSLGLNRGFVSDDYPPASMTVTYTSSPSLTGLFNSSG